MGSLIQALVALAMVLALVVVLGKLAARRLGRVRPDPGTGPVKVTQRIPLGNKSHILVVVAGGRRFLIGAGPHGLRTLGEFDPLEEEDEVEVLDLRDATDPAAALMATWGKERESVPAALLRLVRQGR